MNLFDLFAKISLDTSGYEKGIKEARSEMKDAEKDLKSVTETAKKTAQDYRSDVMKLANVYKQ